MNSRFLVGTLLLFLLWGAIYPPPQFMPAFDELLSRLTLSPSHWNPLLDERIPRLITILCTGASLAVAGAVTQSLFHNPLASPGILGISAGGSLCVIMIFLMKWHLVTPLVVPLAAVIGSLTTLLFIYSLARKNGGVLLFHLILTGIAISTILSAIHGSILYKYRDDWQFIQMTSEWLAGTTYNRNWNHVHMQLPLTLVALSVCFAYRRELNLLSLGDEEAKSLGVDVDTVRWRLFLSISLLIGASLAAIGIIAFFGLILPHLIRQLSGSDHQKLIPLSALTGATTLLGMDNLLRFFKVHSLTIGNISAILGGLFFFLLLVQSRKKVLQTC